jgi:hypothetical protein
LSGWEADASMLQIRVPEIPDWQTPWLAAAEANGQARERRVILCYRPKDQLPSPSLHAAEHSPCQFYLTKPSVLSQCFESNRSDYSGFAG